MPNIPNSQPEKPRTFWEKINSTDIQTTSPFLWLHAYVLFGIGVAIVLFSLSSLGGRPPIPPLNQLSVSEGTLKMGRSVGKSATGWEMLVVLPSGQVIGKDSTNPCDTHSRDWFEFHRDEKVMVWYDQNRILQLKMDNGAIASECPRCSKCSYEESVRYQNDSRGWAKVGLIIGPLVFYAGWWLLTGARRRLRSKAVERGPESV